jgi:hypothetical protein
MTALPCGCCEPSAELTPLAVSNRAGLSAIAYRVGTYGSFRESMLEQIAHAPGLERLATRADDDYSITVVDLWSAVADVLTFYQERYANEAFLRTATQRESIGRLARLIDYGLRPGVAALAWLAFTAEDGKRVRIARRLRVQSVPGQDEQPQIFETLEPIEADARLNRVRVLPAPTAVNPLARGAVEALIAPGEDGLAAARVLAPDDRVLVWSTGAAGDVEELTVRELRVEEERVTVAWARPVQRSWGTGTPASKAGRVFRLFGRTAAASAMRPIANTNVPGGIRWELTPTNLSLPASTTLALESRVEGVAPGMRLLVDDAGGATTVVTVTGVASGPQTLAGLTDTVTILTITPTLPAVADRRRVTVYELVGPPIPFWGYAYGERLTGSSVFLPGRRRADSRIEIGRTITRFEYQPGVAVGVADVAPKRTVLVGDSETAPVVGTVESAAIVGSTVTAEPTAADPTTARESGLDAGSSTQLSGLQSLPFPPTLQLSSATPELRVGIGELRFRRVQLPGSVTTLAGAAAALQAGLAAAGPEPELSLARVFWLAGRLLVFPGGEGGALELLPTERDGTTVRELGLDRDQALPVLGLRSAPLTFPLTFTSPAPEAAVTIGPVGPRTVMLAGSPSIKAFAAALQASLAGADPAPGFAAAQVLILGDRLLVLPGPVGTEIAEYLRIDLSLAEELDLDAQHAFLLGNVAAASHGETVRDEVVGDGDASAPFQRFALKKTPLTSVPSEKAGGLESSLQVSLDGVAWREVAGLYRQDPKAQVYAVRTQDDGTTVVQFGDGRSGAKPPTGRSNVRATYRVGAGVAGRVRSRTLTSALDRPPGLKEVTNPLAARGGADPETIEDARENAPSTVRTFGRAVSLLDFADLARASGEVAKAQAIWIWDGLERAIHLTVAGQRGGLFAREDLRRLGAALTSARDPNYRLRLSNFVPLPVVVRGTVLVDDRYVRDDVLAAVREATLAALAFDAVELGEAVHLSDLYRVIQDVPGVVAADLDELQAKRPADRNRPNADLLPDGTPAPLQPHVFVFSARPDATAPGAVRPSELATVEDPARDVTLAGRGGIDG